MTDKIEVKVQNLENQYRVLKGDVQVVSVELTRLYDEVKKSKEFLIEVDSKLQSKNDFLKELETKKNVILNQIKERDKQLEEKRLELKSKKTYHQKVSRYSSFLKTDS